MKRPTFIDLFAGCGGISLGLLNAGWNGLLAVEKSRDAFLTLRHNLIDGHRLARGRKFNWLNGILEVGPHDVSELANNPKLKSLKEEVDLIAGGPPCQGFSFLGRRTGKDPRNELFRDYLKIVDLIKPKLVLIENVKGISVPFQASEEDIDLDALAQRKSYAALIKDELEIHGYIVQQAVVKASEFGVPQFRPRYLTLAIRKDAFTDKKLSQCFFSALDAMRPKFLENLKLGMKPVTVKDAISDLRTSPSRLIENIEENVPKGFYKLRYKRPQTKYQDLMHRDQHGNLMNGEMDSMRLANHRETTVDRFKELHEKCKEGSIVAGVQISPRARESLKIPTRKSSITLLSPDQPSHTITTLPDDLIHYEEPRIHTVREYARLQSFPDWFQFRGKYTTGGNNRKYECPRYTQVGNAVPPFLAQAIGECLREFYKI